MDAGSSSTMSLHYPSVDDVITPKIVMHFEGLNEAYEFYNDYVKHAGFSIRKDSTRKMNGEIVWKRFAVCSNEGKTDKREWNDKEFVQRQVKNRSIHWVYHVQVCSFVFSSLTTPHKRFTLR